MAYKWSQKSVWAHAGWRRGRGGARGLWMDRQIDRWKPQLAARQKTLLDLEVVVIRQYWLLDPIGSQYIRGFVKHRQTDRLSM